MIASTDSASVAWTLRASSAVAIRPRSRRSASGISLRPRGENTATGEDTAYVEIERLPGRVRLDGIGHEVRRGSERVVAVERVVHHLAPSFARELHHGSIVRRGDEQTRLGDALDEAAERFL